MGMYQTLPLLVLSCALTPERFQVSPMELEEILVQHPLVDEVAVCGVPGETATTEVVRAYIVPRVKSGSSFSNTAAAEELSKYLAERVASYKRLSGGVVFVDSLPKNPTGKILRRVLRSKAIKVQTIRGKL
jgi:4-coumarate--CoA ligase